MKQRKLVPTLLALILATAAAGACNRAANEETGTTVAQPRYSDSDITSAVQGRLYADHDINGGRVDVSADNGVVTLHGMVSSEESKRQALDIARGVDGVTSVRDELTIRPAEGAAAATKEPAVERVASSTDTGWITTKIQAQYFVNPELKPWNIDVTTRSGGIVSLSGEVDDEADKTEAVRIARETEGVTKVEDHLRLEGDSRLGRVRTEGSTEGSNDSDETFGDTFSDAWLTAKVQSKFYLDDDIRGRDIDVSTANGVTTLTGSVRSEAERRQALAIARNTDGVLDVRDQLKIMATEGDSSTSGNRAETTTRSTGQAIEDGWITTKIQSQYFLDSRVKGHDIDVDTNKGVVTLMGSVPSPELKQAAEEIARDTEGTVRVINRLTVS